MPATLSATRQTNPEIEDKWPKSSRVAGNALGLEDASQTSRALLDLPILLSPSSVPQRRQFDNPVMATGWVQNQLGDYHYVEHGRIEEVSESSSCLLQSSRSGNNASCVLSLSTTPPPCPKPKLSDLPLELEYYDAENAEDISLPKIMINIEFAQMEITALADVSGRNYPLDPCIQLLFRVSRLLCLALSEILRAIRLRYDITEEEWGCADEFWRRKYDERLSSLQRSIQRLREVAKVAYRRFDKISPIIEKLKQHYLKLVNLASQFNGAFVRLKAVYHYQLMQDLNLRIQQDENQPGSGNRASRNSDTKKHRRHNLIILLRPSSR